MDSLSLYGLITLFAHSFLAATIIPFGSEATFIALQSLGLNPWLCLWTASIGNTLGGLSGYALGRFGRLEWIEKYLHITHRQLLTTQRHINRFGPWLAFFSFLPFIGDFIPLALGLMRSNFVITSLFIFLGKFLRYFILTLPFI